MPEPDAIHPHGPLEDLGSGLWIVAGAWGRSPLARRMTVMELPRGGLLLHSSIRLDATGLDELDRLGEPRVIVVPNAFHFSEAGFYAQRHPRALVLVPSEAADRLRRRLPRIDGTLEGAWPASCDGIAERAPLAGTRFAEVALLHRPSRTLVLTDLCFNLAAADLTPPARALMRLNGAVDRFGPTRLARLLFVRDRRALAGSLREILAWDFDRIVVSHGRVLETGGRSALAAAFPA